MNISPIIVIYIYILELLYSTESFDYVCLEEFFIPNRLLPGKLGPTAQFRPSLPAFYSRFDYICLLCHFSHFAIYSIFFLVK